LVRAGEVLPSPACRLEGANNPVTNIHRSTHSLGDRGPYAQLGISQEDRNAKEKMICPTRNAVLSVAFSSFCVTSVSCVPTLLSPVLVESPVEQQSVVTWQPA